MSKIQSIEIKNFKAISELEIDFKGCTAIITSGNNKGKTSFLRGIPDRIRFVRPEIPVKEGEDSGKGELTLDTGEKFIWEFDKVGKDKLTYVTDKGIKTSVTKELGNKFFPPTFDIDKFLQSTPKEQAKQLQKIIGIDFTDIDSRYLIAYNDRTEKNRDAEKYHVKLSSMIKVDKVEAVDLSELQAKKETERNRINELYLKNKSSNDKFRSDYGAQCNDMRKNIEEFNNLQSGLTVQLNACTDAHNILKANGYTGSEVEKFLSNLRKHIQPQKTFIAPPEPNYIQERPDDSALQEIDAQILSASETNTKAKAYTDYIAYKSDTDTAKNAAKIADDLVKKIEDERQKLIESAKFPKGISISSEGITIDGFPLDRNQISTSKLYTTALRIASMNLGEVKTLYFDASFLDKNSLMEIEQWANENKLQLLIERPDYEGGEIRYELVETI